MKSSKHLDCCPSTFTSRKHGSPDSWLWKLYTGSQATWILYTVLFDLIAHFFLSEYAIFNNDTVFYIKKFALTEQSPFDFYIFTLPYPCVNIHASIYFNLLMWSSSLSRDISIILHLLIICIILFFFFDEAEL